MEITCVKGDRVVLTDNRCQVFVGEVKNVNADLGRILLSNVVQLPGNIGVDGYRHFDKDEIVEVRILDENNPQVSVCGTESEDCETVLTEKRLNEVKKLQLEYRYIKDFGNNFQTAVSLLKKCERVAVYGVDVSKGRGEPASVIGISTPSGIFLFDLKALGSQAFDKGLREVLESQDVVKVTHDSRLFSDCLKHKHLVSLENVRDVEAEDVMVVLQERGIVRRHSRTLDYLIGVYLGVKVVELSGSEDWTERPLPANFLEILVSLVSFLLPLQDAIEKKYLRRLVSASSIYNNHLRNLDLFDFLNNDSNKTPREHLKKLTLPQKPRSWGVIKKQEPRRPDFTDTKTTPSAAADVNGG